MVVTSKPGVDFGTKMRRAREARGLSLRQIANTTKISLAALEGLESNDISRLPGGIFSRAFVRAYAGEIGLNAEDTVRDFIEEFPTDSVTAGSPHVPQEDHEAIESNRESAATVVKLIAISLPVVGAILYFTLRAPVSSRPSPPQAVATVAANSEPLIFEVVATEPVIISIDVDGMRRSSRLVAAGERLEFQAGREMSMTMSDAAAVQLNINGQPATALGARGESRTVRIDRANYGAFLASQ